MLCSYLVWVLHRTNALDVHWGHPAVASKTQLSDPLVGPPGDNRLPSRVTGGMVVVPTFWAGLGVAAAPDANVHSVDWGSRALLEERVMDDQLAHRASSSICPRLSAAYRLPQLRR